MRGVILSGDLALGVGCVLYIWSAILYDMTQRFARNGVLYPHPSSLSSSLRLLCLIGEVTS